MLSDRPYKVLSNVETSSESPRLTRRRTRSDAKAYLQSVHHGFQSEACTVRQATTRSKTPLNDLAWKLVARRSFTVRLVLLGSVLAMQDISISSYSIIEDKGSSLTT